VEVQAHDPKDGAVAWWPATVSAIQGDSVSIRYSLDMTDNIEQDFVRPYNTNLCLTSSDFQRSNIKIPDNIKNNIQLQDFTLVSSSGILVLTLNHNTNSLFVLGSRDAITRASRIAAIIIKHKAELVRLQEATKKKEARVKDMQLKLQEGKLVEFKTSQDLIGYVIGFDGSNLAAAKKIHGIDSINVDSGKCTVTILAKNPEAALEARNKLEYITDNYSIPKSQIGLIVGRKFAKLQEIKDISKVARLHLLRSDDDLKIHSNKVKEKEKEREKEKEKEKERDKKKNSDTSHPENKAHPSASKTRTTKEQRRRLAREKVVQDEAAKDETATNQSDTDQLDQHLPALSESSNSRSWSDIQDDEDVATVDLQIIGTKAAVISARGLLDEHIHHVGKLLEFATQDISIKSKALQLGIEGTFIRRKKFNQGQRKVTNRPRYNSNSNENSGSNQERSEIDKVNGNDIEAPNRNRKNKKKTPQYRMKVNVNHSLSNTNQVGTGLSAGPDHNSSSIPVPSVYLASIDDRATGTKTGKLSNFVSSNGVGTGNNINSNSTINIINNINNTTNKSKKHPKGKNKDDQVNGKNVVKTMNGGAESNILSNSNDTVLKSHSNTGNKPNTKSYTLNQLDNDNQPKTNKINETNDAKDNQINNNGSKGNQDKSKDNKQDIDKKTIYEDNDNDNEYNDNNNGNKNEEEEDGDE